MTKAPAGSRATMQEWEDLTHLPPVTYDGIIDEMAGYFETADWQRRDYLEPDRRLMVVAQYRAHDMVANDYFSHHDLNGVFPNAHVINAGYKLPSWYKPNANQVESIALGFSSPVRALDALAASKAHGDHMAGSLAWATHVHYGVGFDWIDDRRIYVVITAPLEPGDEPPPREPLKVLYLPYVAGGVVARESDYE